jgi:hypothetical protein
MVSGLAAATVSERVAVAVFGLGDVLSEAFTTKEYSPGAVGVPVICPETESDSPGGKDPLAIDQLYGVVPPVAKRLAE